MYFTMVPLPPVYDSTVKANKAGESMGGFEATMATFGGVNPLVLDGTLVLPPVEHSQAAHHHARQSCQTIATPP